MQKTPQKILRSVRSAPYAELNPKQREAVDTIDGPVLVLAGPGTGKTQLLSIRASNILSKKSGIRPENILIVTYTNSAAKAMKERLVKVIGLKGYDLDVGTFHSFANSIIQESEDAAHYVGDRIQMTEIEQVKAIVYILDRAKGISEIRPFRAPYVYLKDITQRIGELKKDGISPERFLDYVNSLDPVREAVEPKYAARMKAFGVVYKMYEEIKEGKDPNIFDERGRYDFDDMILLATEALKKETRLADEYRQRYRYVMVDEYQDTNEAQLELLFTLLDYREPNLCCVGDDDQSIYRFQGASVGNFTVLKETFPSTKVITLYDNYRSTRKIIDFASSVIRTIPRDARVEEKMLVSTREGADTKIEFREFTTVTEELLFIVERVRQLKAEIERTEELDLTSRRHPYNAIAVLVRKRRDIVKVIDAFLQAGIPYATDGKEDVSGEKRVRQLLDVLELAELHSRNAGEKDFALYKVLSSDYFGIPLPDILRLVRHARSKSRSHDDGGSRDASLVEHFLRSFPFTRDELAARHFSVKEDHERFPVLRELGLGSSPKMVRAAWVIARLLSDAHAKPVHAILIGFVHDAGIFTFILEEYASKQILRLRDLRSLGAFINMVKSADTTRPGVRLHEFMADLKMARENGLPVQGALVTMTQDGVRIFTAHGSKGQEFHTVFIPFCLQNKNWPTRPRPEKIPLPPGLFKTRGKKLEKASLKQLYLQDEARLFYVASTRARSHLVFSSSPQEDEVSSYYLKELGQTAERESAIPWTEEQLLGKSLLSESDSSDPCADSEGVLRDMVRDFTLNPTSLNNYLYCARRFLYDNVLRLPGPKKQSLVFGTCVHKALEETYRYYKERDSFPTFDFFEAVFKNELRFQGPETAIELRCTDQLFALKGWFEQAARNPVKPVELERKILVTIGDGIVFTGKFDKVEVEDEERKIVKIVDYKTGKPDAHVKAIDECDDLASDACDGYVRQLVAYKLLFERDRRLSKLYKVGYGELVFIEPLAGPVTALGLKKGDFVSRKLEIRDDMVKALEGLIKEVWADVSSLEFDKLPERDTGKCGRCDYDGICWG